MYKGITEYFKFPQSAVIKENLLRITGLTDSAVFSIVAGASAVTLILVFPIPHTHTPVLTGDITAWVHCEKQEELMSKDREKCLHKLWQITYEAEEKKVIIYHCSLASCSDIFLPQKHLSFLCLSD